MVLSMVGMDYLYYPLQVAYGPGSYWYFRNNPFTTAPCMAPDTPLVCI